MSNRIEIKENDTTCQCLAWEYARFTKKHDEKAFAKITSCNLNESDRDFARIVIKVIIENWGLSFSNVDIWGAISLALRSVENLYKN